jgi:hypothetical protein
MRKDDWIGHFYISNCFSTQGEKKLFSNVIRTLIFILQEFIQKSRTDEKKKKIFFSFFSIRETKLFSLIRNKKKIFLRFIDFIFIAEA